jgi:hypothetical protein
VIKKSALIITSINQDAASFKIYDNINEYDFILVGDKKGPRENPLLNGTFLGLEEQRLLDFSSTNKLPFDHYCRKNLGYLYAMRTGYDVIYETDDDNLPNKHFPPSLEKSSNLEMLSNADGFVNIYSEYSDLQIWPRGYPLEKINPKVENERMMLPCKIGVWQGLANLDPDVDAINRLVLNYTDVIFSEGRYAIKNGNFCPFNSQNTTWDKEAFSLMYLPCTVPFRMTDILRSFVTQRILWELGLSLGFHEATVEQARNDHNLMSDFADEQSMYLDTEGIVAVLLKQELRHKNALECLEKCYCALIQAGYVDEEEMEYLSCWIYDIEQMNFHS